jgi:hypothetical protein
MQDRIGGRMISRYPFATRVRLARQLLARGPAPMPLHIADQLDSAATEIREAHDQLGAVMPLLAPDRRWHHRTDAAPSEDTRAYLLAGVLGCIAYCVHLRRGGPQPAFIRLPLRRADCGRCAQTIRRPLTAEDECDLCGTHGVEMFSPFAVRHGPALIAGDVCQSCAAVLGIVVDEKVGA